MNRMALRFLTGSILVAVTGTCMAQTATPSTETMIQELAPLRTRSLRGNLRNLVPERVPAATAATAAASAATDAGGANVTIAVPLPTATPIAAPPQTATPIAAPPQTATPIAAPPQTATPIAVPLPTATPASGTESGGQAAAAVEAPTPAPTPSAVPITAAAPPEVTPEPRPSLSLLIEFDFDSARVRPQSRQALANLSQALQSEVLRDSRFAVEGHTDAKGAADYNRKLSEKRAIAVREFLKAQGVAEERLVASGKGASELANTSEPFAAENRRVRIVNLD